MVSGQVTWDETGEAAAALRYAVDSYGAAVLARAERLGNVLSDLVPGTPRERHLLVAAAEHNVAGLLVTRVREGLSPEAAGRMVAGSLAAEQGVAADGARWAVATMAATLGYETGSLLEPDAPTLIDLPPVPRSHPVPPPPVAPAAPTADLPARPARPLPPPPPWEQAPPRPPQPVYPPPVYQAPVYQPPVYAPPIVYAPPVFVRRRRSLLRRLWLLLGLALAALTLWGLLSGSPNGPGGTTTTTSAPAPAAVVGAGTLAAS
jgi:hypothetical protein